MSTNKVIGFPRKAPNKPNHPSECPKEDKELLEAIEFLTKTVTPHMKSIYDQLAAIAEENEEIKEMLELVLTNAKTQSASKMLSKHDREMLWKSQNHELAEQIEMEEVHELERIAKRRAAMDELNDRLEAEAEENDE